MKNFYFLFLFFLFFTFKPIHAATIKGVVTDQQSKEPIIEAMVQLEGTQYGAITELDGSFVIKEVPAETYKVVCIYIGYAKFEQQVIIQNEDQEITISIPLTEESNHKDIVIVGERDKESDETARKTEQNADNVVNVMSAKTIQLLPDINVGNVL